MVAKKKSTTKKAVTKKAPAKKAVTKKAAVKKAVTKRTVTKKAVTKRVAAKPAAIKAIAEPMNKTQLLSAICEKTELAKKDVAAVFDALADLMEGHIKKRGAGTFTIPGLLKVKTIRKPAQKARKNVPNPFKPGELMDVAAKPARTVVKVLPLKKVKDMAQ